jgi:UDP-N-acetylglucosamine 1-carboxyvinyltransferase
VYKLTIQGGTALKGTIKAAGSKNSSLPILFSSILADGPLTLNNTPHLSDISTTLRLLMDMGAEFILESNGALFIDSSKLTNLVADYNLVKTMRASILALGPMLAKYGEAKVSLPGGCAIGSRPVNLHLQALEELGATIEVKNGYIFAKAKKLIGKNIYFDQVSVTATENIVMAAALAKGITVLKNCATEPEVIQLCEVIQSGGVQIEGIGTETLKIFGTSGELLNIDEVKVIPDRIEAGTYLCAGAITKSQLTVSSVEPKHLTTILDKFREMGFKLKIEKKVLQYFQMKILNQLIL